MAKCNGCDQEWCRACNPKKRFMSKCDVCGTTCPVCKIATHRVAKDFPVGTLITMKKTGHKGKIICNELIQGDEVVVVEFTHGIVHCENVNDMVRCENAQGI